MKLVLITAEEMAKTAGINAKRFRRALRAASLRWHTYYTRWTVLKDSTEHDDMRRILLSIQPTD